MRIVGLSPKGKLALFSLLTVSASCALWYFFTKTMLVINGLACVAMLALGIKIKRASRT